MQRPMQERTLAAALFALVTIWVGAAVHGDQLVVPGDAATLQEAIDMALPGDVILLRTPDEQGGVTIDKPLTILGDPFGNVNEPSSPFCPTAKPGIRLAGSGYGSVTLANLFIGNGEDCFRPPAALDGGGFDELRLIDCTVRAPIAGKTGQGFGSPGIRTSVPYLFLVRTTVVGSNPDAEYCAPLPPGREAGIDAPNSTVVLIDCSIRGGQTVVFCCDYCECPTTLPSDSGTGGDGVICDALYRSGGTIAGGIGATYFAHFVPCGLKQPDGAPWVASSYTALPDVLSPSGAMRIGGVWSLGYVASGPVTVLFAALGTGLPFFYPGTGWSFGNPNASFPVSQVAPGVQTLNIAIPPLAFLVGMDVVFQLTDFTDGVSEPELGSILP